MADRNLIYKRNGQFAYSGIVEPYIVQTASEKSDIPTSGNAQAVIILGNGGGMTLEMRMPGGDWTEV